MTDVIAIADRDGYIKSEHDFVNLSILPTNRCNFSCAYCYSAKGRASETINIDTVKTTIDWFVSRDRKTLHITFFGGGEPMLTWNEIVRPAITYVREKYYDKRISFTLITNGLILPYDFVDICKKVSLDIVVSFEVLEQLQQRQRRNYAIVKQNILNMVENNLNPRINTVITDESVELITNILTELAATFPGIDYISMEPEVGQHTKEFYDTFTQEFLRAISIGNKLGIHVTTSALRNCDVTVDRYCAGEFALTASGDISLCPCIASVTHPDYSRWIYGRVEADKVVVDTDRLTSLLEQRVYTQPWCRTCFAKYNCGGGCINKTIDMDNIQDNAFCHYTRNFLKTIIMKRLENE